MLLNGGLLLEPKYEPFETMLVELPTLLSLKELPPFDEPETEPVFEEIEIDGLLIETLTKLIEEDLLEAKLSPEETVVDLETLEKLGPELDTLDELTLLNLTLEWILPPLNELEILLKLELAKTFGEETILE